MARQPQPWRRRGVGGAWYAQVNRVKIWLAPAEATKTQAQEALYQKLAERGEPKRPAKGLSTKEVLALFGSMVQQSMERGERSSKTFVRYARFLDSAEKAFGAVSAASLRPHHVQAWADADPPGWGPTTRFQGITVIKAAFNWARKQGYIEASPIADMERPTPRKRIHIMTAEQVDLVLGAIRDQPFHDLVTALRETGCRPNEVITLTADRIDLSGGIWWVVNKTKGKTGEAFRRVYLSERMMEISRRLLATHPDGHIFRTNRDTPYNDILVAQRFRKIRIKLGFGPECTAYALRHLYVTDALERGVPPATVAELVGHSSQTMTLGTYNQIKGRTEHLRGAAQMIRP
jgi:integrase